MALPGIPMRGGRPRSEVHGQPKKLARVNLELRGDLLVATVERNGIEVLTATLPYKVRRAS